MIYRFDFGVFQAELSTDVIVQVESIVRQLIEERLPVERLMVPLSEAVVMEHVTLVPGETYPQTVSIIRVQKDDEHVVSLEPCCGTHVRNTADLEQFAILSCKSAGVASRSVRAVTRSCAVESLARSTELEHLLVQLENDVQQQLTMQSESTSAVDCSHLLMVIQLLKHSSSFG